MSFHQLLNNNNLYCILNVVPLASINRPGHPEQSVILQDLNYGDYYNDDDVVYFTNLSCRVRPSLINTADSAAVSLK